METISSDCIPLGEVKFVSTKQSYASHANNKEVHDPKSGYRNEYEWHVILEVLQEWKLASYHVVCRLAF